MPTHYPITYKTIYSINEPINDIVIQLNTSAPVTWYVNYFRNDYNLVP